MGEVVLRCPLCCDRTFDTKPELIEHLAIISESITCPICSNKCSSVAHLVEHLTLDNCQADNTVETITFINTELKNNNQHIENINQNSENMHYVQVSHELQKDLSNHLSAINESINDGPDTSKMYVEFLSKPLNKPCLQTQELKLVKDEGGTSRYVFMVNDDDAGLDAGSTVVTKQNNDGTISLTTVTDMKMEASDPMMVQAPEESSEEIYSCNTCGVSFTSVLDHIQNYHNDQDVVVEEPLEEMDTGPAELEFQSNMVDPLATEDKHASRRMITDTGAIIETPVEFKSISESPDPNVIPGGKTSGPIVIKEELVENSHPIRRYVVVDSVVKDIKRTDNKTGPYHRVVMKEVTRINGDRIKIFNCMSCNIYVSSLDDFKSHPCKQSKYLCPHCPVEYENSKSLCAHMKVHKAKPGPAAPAAAPAPVVVGRSVFSCEVCNTLFTTNKSLKLHKRMHDPIKARRIDPPVEGANGEEVSTGQFLCSICNKLIPVDYREVHQESHKVKPDLNCEICNKEFLSEEYLEMHMNVHLSDKAPPARQDSRSLPYSCLYCDRRFSRPHEKVKHERIHTGEKPHSCEICGKSFRVSYCLTLHMRTHTGARPYSCQHCGKRFKAHSVYNHHLLTHSEVRAYKCPYCPKAFKTSVQLAGHKNSHTKPFSCQQCNRPFASLYAVRVHTETHARQNSLKFSCTLCGASYARAFALKDHIKVAHKKEANKVELTLHSMLAKENTLAPSTNDNTESWEIQNGDDNAAEEITIDAKNLSHEVGIPTDVPIINPNFNNELAVP